MIKIYKKLNKIIIFSAIKFIRFYQILISPMINNNCRFVPTCSEYSIESIKVYGLLKGSLMTLKRISSCHPFGKSGYDPVIKKVRKN